MLRQNRSTKESLYNDYLFGSCLCMNQKDQSFEISHYNNQEPALLLKSSKRNKLNIYEKKLSLSSKKGNRSSLKENSHQKYQIQFRQDRNSKNPYQSKENEAFPEDYYQRKQFPQKNSRNIGSKLSLSNQNSSTYSFQNKRKLIKLTFKIQENDTEKQTPIKKIESLKLGENLQTTRSYENETLKSKTDRSYVI